MDAKAGTVTLDHEPVKTLKWPAMTMGFKVEDKSMFDKLAEGKKVEIEFKQVGKETLIDPVCGMRVTPQSKHHVSHAGSKYFFCSAGCAAKFAADPEKYLRSASGAETAAPERLDAIYTCPMHPQIRQVGPGNCPICGMSLEPADASVAEDDTELRLMTRRLWIAAALSLPIALMAMTEFAPTLHQRLINVMGPWFGWSQFLLATPVVLWCWSIFLQARLAIDHPSLRRTCSR